MTDEQLERRFSVVNEPLDPDPRFAAKQNQTARDQSSANDAVKFIITGADPLLLRQIDF